MCDRRDNLLVADGKVSAVMSCLVEWVNCADFDLPFEQNSIASCNLSSLRKENEQCLQDFTIVGLSHGGEGISLLDELDERKKGAHDTLLKLDTPIGELEISRSGGASFFASIRDTISDSGITTSLFRSLSSYCTGFTVAVSLRNQISVGIYVKI